MSVPPNACFCYRDVAIFISIIYLIRLITAYTVYNTSTVHKLYLTVSLTRSSALVFLQLLYHEYIFASWIRIFSRFEAKLTIELDGWLVGSFHLAVNKNNSSNNNSK